VDAVYELPIGGGQDGAVNGVYREECSSRADAGALGNAVGGPPLGKAASGVQMHLARVVVVDLHYDFQQALHRLRRRREEAHLKHGGERMISVDDVIVDGFKPRAARQ
jgi:hypothetical protein